MKNNNKKATRTLIFALCAAIVLWANTAMAATITVSSNADGGGACPGATCTLRDAIATAAPGDTIDFAVTGTITLTGGELVINKNLTIQGPGASVLSLNGNHASRVVFVDATVSASIAGLTITNGLLAAGPIDDVGAGIFNKGTLVLKNVTVSGNISNTISGGAGICNTGTLTVRDSLINNNIADGPGFVAGGGISSVNDGRISVLKVINSTISNNLAVGDSEAGGGGIWSYGGTVMVENSTVSGNTAQLRGGGNAYGGGIYNFAESMTLINSTVSGNSVTGYSSSTRFKSGGGGIFNESRLTLKSSTISNNSVTINNSEGGGIYNLYTLWLTDGFTLLHNTIVAGNFSQGSTSDITHDPVRIDSSYNLIGTGGSGGLANGVNNNQVGVVSPGLGPLASNGGLTQTHALLINSPALDKGNSFGLTTDQRGQVRPFDNPSIANAMGGDGTDIGAFEENPPNQSPIARDDSSTVVANSRANFINVLANDTDVDNDTLTVSAVTQGSYGTVAITNSGAGISYTPNPNFIGADSFTYTVNDGRGGSHAATVNVNVTHADDDADGVPNSTDNCQTVANADQADSDGDGIGNACDANPSDGPTGDPDGDGAPNNADNCPSAYNPDQIDTDADGQGNACDTDDDGDGIADGTDNCQLTVNANQVNNDGDAFGDACDPDDDNDGVADVNDSFPFNPNESVDTDGDGTGNNADSDDDNDGQTDADEVACGSNPLSQSSKSLDNDNDSRPDCVDADDDNDGVSDVDELVAGSNPFNAVSKPEICDGTDNDLDGSIDEGFTNTDGDSQANCVDSDDDNDGVSDANEIVAGSDPLNGLSKPEICDGVDNDLNEGVDEGFANSDGDAQANCIDPDDDNDGQTDSDEVACGSDPLNAASRSLDTDFDNRPDCVDTDDDNDGISDSADNCSLMPNTNQANNDNDVQGDICDADDDNDGVLDAQDPFPFNANETVDTDGDGIGDNADFDDDGDGQTDANEIACGSDPIVAASKSTDTDNDNIPNCVDTDDDGDGVSDTQDAFPLDSNESVDTDGDGIGNNADADDDGDGISDTAETAAGSDPFNHNSTPEVCDGKDNDLNEGVDEGFADTDGDTMANCVDPDDDGDGQFDTDETSCGSDPLNNGSKSGDTDGDYTPDCVDSDDDNDGVPDTTDNCRVNANSNQANFDGDTQGDACDLDDDNDGVPDAQDAFPLNPSETIDTDGDGTGNNSDTDDDNDLQTDVYEVACGSNPLLASSKAPDKDNDNRPDCIDPDDDNDNIPDACDIDSNPGARDYDKDGIVDSSSCDTVIGPPINQNQCKNGGWQFWTRANGTIFRNQGDCIQYVNTGK